MASFAKKSVKGTLVMQIVTHIAIAYVRHVDALHIYGVNVNLEKGIRLIYGLIQIKVFRSLLAGSL